MKLDNVNSQQNTNLVFKRDRVDLEQELINKFNLPNSTSISKVSELFNYENQKIKTSQVLQMEQVNSFIFNNMVLTKKDK